MILCTQVTQMKFRLSEGNGECLYYLGALTRLLPSRFRDVWTAHANMQTAELCAPANMADSSRAHPQLLCSMHQL